MERESRIRRWFGKMAERPWATPALCGLSFLDACVSPIIPEVLLAPLCLLRPERRWYYALWCGVWSVLGGVFGYALGYFFWEAGLRELLFARVPGFTAERFESVAAGFGEGAFLWIFIAGFTPLPYKLFAVAAGVGHEHVSLATFVAASLASRIPRFLLTVAILHVGKQGLVRLPSWAVGLILLAIFATLVR
jgi:membrane protein YqaA with SNARE-associated domain